MWHSTMFCDNSDFILGILGVFLRKNPEFGNPQVKISR